MCYYMIECSKNSTIILLISVIFFTDYRDRYVVSIFKSKLDTTVDVGILNSVSVTYLYAITHNIVKYKGLLFRLRFAQTVNLLIQNHYILVPQMIEKRLDVLLDLVNIIFFSVYM